MKNPELKTVIYEVVGGIGKNTASALARAVVKYAKQHPEIFENRKEDDNGKTDYNTV